MVYDDEMQGIEAARPGATLGISPCHSILRRSAALGCRADFCGHGLGRIFHDTPNILHYGRSGEGLTLREGMFFTIEPMLNLGKPAVKISVTVDRRHPRPHFVGAI